ncbi:saccharopine dehydrogenase family protein [Pseudomonas sp. 2FE]|uniref:saccharopine dehydrogenase family protein n=1 Tax=Pseudomonas sp. 2FE TaxID=2502190 RepID=UPI002113BC93|nr:saccharopine dehydrogenase NADP-binding domain-containing protein [Pseudomonas sp. 2FE]
MASAKMRVVVLGGLGNFGARICRSLSLDVGVEVIAAGRSVATSDKHIFEQGQTVSTARLDIDSPDLEQQLIRLSPDIVIHCAGPFQSQDYRVAEASCAAGAHYVDISDGRAFVSSFAHSLNDKALAAGVCAISGASSVPGLSSAVVDSLAKRFSRIDAISIAIAPGQQAPRGTATLAAVFSYAGRPFQRLHNGHWSASHGWQDMRAIRFSRLGVRWAAACDVPDLELFPARYPSVKTVEFRAALELRTQHLALWLAAAMRRVGIPLPIERYASQLNSIANNFLDRYGSDCGGMMVKISGTRLDGTPGNCTWHLTAPDRHGPEIPCMAALLVTRKLVKSELNLTGAFACTGLLELDEFEPEFRRWGITTEIEESS